MQISYFWDWITRSVSAALNWLSQTWNAVPEFRDLVLAVFGFAVVGSYLIWPLLAPDRGSDKARKKKGKSEEE